MSVSGKVSVTINLTETKTQDAVTASAPFAQSVAWAIANGTAAGKADRVWTGTHTLAASASEDLDLSGSLATVLGTTFVTVKCKLLFLFNRATSPGAITAGRGASGGWTWISAVSAGVVIPSNGFVCWCAQTDGVAVVATTADLVHIAADATAGTYTYDIAVVGTSA